MKTVMMAVTCPEDIDVVTVMEKLSIIQSGLAIQGFQVMVMVQDPDTPGVEADAPALGCRYPGPPCT